MKYQVVTQHSEEDCGALVLLPLPNTIGRNFTLNRIREAVGTGQLGTTLLGLRRGAEALGFNARSVRASNEILDRMNQAPLPAIIHWKGYHWVVLYGQKGKKYIVADPAANIRYISRKELIEAWPDMVMLLLEPDSVRFYAQPDEKIGGFGRFVRRVLPYRGILFEAFLCALVLGLISLTSPFLIQILTDDVLVRGDTRLLGAVIGAVIVMNFVGSSLQLIQYNLIASFCPTA
ncbi:hypothetical protein ANSO36C_36860 [Nostoc cf. commune SO-36]|uniref:Peptidase C39 domain-containing protein n=1 Tax=Nostoc cf. commune SO-36 TaxID=449208 RepID=A0ABM7Z4C5_NOSCO|nr:hypothetical protein ANSO36C_36860 [Nostoc cf. commune SO-36]